MKLSHLLTAVALILTIGLTSQTTKAQTTEINFGNDSKAPLSVIFGYTNKVWVTQTEDGTQYENFWGEPDKRLHGFQFGTLCKPYLPIGLGIRTGLLFEGYMSSSDYVKERGWDDFNELSIYLPLHASWRIPLGPYVSVTPFFGLGFNWAIYGTFKEDNRYYYDYDDHYHGPIAYQKYGNGIAPKRWNNQLEWGGDLRIMALHFGFTYSKGLRDHHLYKGYETFQDKISFTIGFDLSGL